MISAPKVKRICVINSVSTIKEEKSVLNPCCICQNIG